MKPYQIEGLNWLIDHHKNGTNGILADEIGLGKTLQVISILGYLMNLHEINGLFLVVAPLVTLNNWDTELKRFRPSFCVIVFHGGLPSSLLIPNQVQVAAISMLLVTNLYKTLLYNVELSIAYSSFSPVVVAIIKRPKPSSLVSCSKINIKCYLILI